MELITHFLPDWAFLPIKVNMKYKVTLISPLLCLSSLKFYSPSSQPL